MVDVMAAASNHYLNQGENIGNWDIENICQRIFIQFTLIFIDKIIISFQCTDVI